MQHKSHHELKTGQTPYEYVCQRISALHAESACYGWQFKVQELIEECTGVSPSTVRRILKRLEREGFIQLSPSTDSTGMKIPQWVWVVNYD